MLRCAPPCPQEDGVLADLRAELITTDRLCNTQALVRRWEKGR